MTDYQKFQLQWMIDHGHSLDELIEELDRVQTDWAEEGDTVQDIYFAWEHEIGFGGELWPCEIEWNDYKG